MSIGTQAPITAEVTGEIPATVQLEQTVDLGNLGKLDYSKVYRLAFLLGLLAVVAWFTKRK
jgi:hypothetical protein